MNFVNDNYFELNYINLIILNSTWKIQELFGPTCYISLKEYSISNPTDIKF